MSKIESIYGEFLHGEQQKRNPKHKDYFRASSAGSCFRKQYYMLRQDDYEQNVLDDRVMRLLRLGTIVHADIEKALNIYAEKNDDVTILTEKEIILPELNVVGHLDAALLNYEGDDCVSAEVFDLKTCASYKWRMKFGRNKEKNPSFNYELQVGTYGLGIRAMYEVSEVSLSLLWYNKDTSAMREQKIDALQWTDAAMEYWTELSETLVAVDDPETDLIPGVDFGVPMMDWECRYCGFTQYCKGI